MPLYDLSEFLKLSSALNYNLSAASFNRYNVMMYMIGGKRLSASEKKDREYKASVMETLSYLFNAYSHKRRQLGPMAVLHPLRSAALLAHVNDHLTLLDLLTALLHDVLEDVGPAGFDTGQWRVMEVQLDALLGRLGPKNEKALMARLLPLTRRPDESYYQYIGRLLAHSTDFPAVVPVKLADRLDNTLDMRIALTDPLEGVDFFEIVFQILFVNNYPGYAPEMIHTPATAINGAKRLYQLFKNAVLLSLIRQNADFSASPPTQILFQAVADASLKEAQRNLIHVIGFHFKDVAAQRLLLQETMEYCYSGRSDLATKPDGKRLLDGLFATYFAPNASEARNTRLDQLYLNKPLTFEAAIAFVVIFISFKNNPRYFVQGISAEGISPR
ncbi:MAG: hypothetical protein MUP74_03660 [Desulfobacterales bacterium]|nr:hypothetical protein [Desulfobacterales bacterium]